MNRLKGYRTQIAGWLMALTPALAMFGYQIDPIEVSDFINNFADQLVVLYLTGGIAVHWFRSQAGK